MGCCSVVPPQESFGSCPVLYPEVVVPSRPQVHPCGPVLADVMDSVRFAFCLCSDWFGAGHSHVHSVLCPTPCQSRAGLLHCRILLLQSKAAMEAPCPGVADQRCCHSAAKMLPPPQWWLRLFGPCCQGSGAGLAHLPSAGLLQIFMVVFESKTTFIK